MIPRTPQEEVGLPILHVVQKYNLQHLDVSARLNLVNQSFSFLRAELTCLTHDSQHVVGGALFNLVDLVGLDWGRRVGW